MSKLLAQAIEEAQKLPESEQDWIGAVLLAEMQSERRWDELLAEPSAVMERMADEVLADYRAGRTEPLDPDDL